MHREKIPEALALFCNQTRLKWKKVDIDVNSNIFYHTILIRSIKSFCYQCSVVEIFAVCLYQSELQE